MARGSWPVGMLLLFLAGGCLGDGANLLVTPNPFGDTPVNGVPVKTSYSAASEETAVRVAQVGAKMVEANKGLSVRPRFTTIGAPTEEIFHRGTREVFITEGLAKKCKTDGQLAALLALELGRIVSEREALVLPEVRM